MAHQHQVHKPSKHKAAIEPESGVEPDDCLSTCLVSHQELRDSTNLDQFLEYTTPVVPAQHHFLSLPEEAMAAIFQGIGAAATLPPAEKFHSQSRKFVSARKGSLFVVRSDGRPSFGSSPQSRGAQHLITNAVAAKADASAISAASKPGHTRIGLL